MDSWLNASTPLTLQFSHPRPGDPRRVRVGVCAATGNHRARSIGPRRGRTGGCSTAVAPRP